MVANFENNPLLFVICSLIWMLTIVALVDEMQRKHRARKGATRKIASEEWSCDIDSFFRAPVR